MSPMRKVRKSPTVGLAVTIALALIVAALPAASGASGPPAPAASEREAPTESADMSASHKLASPGLVLAGEDVTFTIELRNDGDSATTVDVTDPLPPPFTYVADSESHGASYVAASNTLVWDQVLVEAGATVALTFQATAGPVDEPFVSTNVAAIASENQRFVRQASVQVFPGVTTPPPAESDLTSSRKAASQNAVVVGDALSYSIYLHNSGTASATATVVDSLPDEMAYVTDSASHGGIYDSEQHAVTWEDISVPSADSVTLTFEAMATAVDTPTLTTNLVNISDGNEDFNRFAEVLVLPEGETGDVTPPRVDGLIIDGQDILNTPEVTLYVDASDDTAVQWMMITEWVMAAQGPPRWQEAQSSDWVPFAEEVDWTLTAQNGVHFVGAWVADSAENVSFLSMNGLDYASLLLAEDTVASGHLVPYLAYYEAGVNVSSTLTTLSGDADLFVWFPGNFSLPDLSSTAPGTESDQIAFTTPYAGTYLFVVYGAADSTYSLEITPGGGPSAWAASSAGSSEMAGSSAPMKSSQDQDEGKVPAGWTGSPLAWSGVDPLAVTGSPAEIIYCRFDFDGDCDIDIADIAMTAVRWNTVAGDGRYRALFDINVDGEIDIADIAAVAVRWGCQCGDVCYQ